MQEYLKKYGYIDEKNDIGYSCNIDEKVLEGALKSFQNIAGLKATGLYNIYIDLIFFFKQKIHNFKI